MALTIMKRPETVTLTYDKSNPVAKKTLDFFLSLGIFEKAKNPDSFAESDNDIKNGRVYTAKDADDLIIQCLK